MKNFSKLSCSTALVVLFCSCARQSLHPVSVKPDNTQRHNNIRVIELRNYLVKPGSADKFNTLFSDHFLKPMQDMGVAVLGKYKIVNSEDHFVWVRAYKDMAERVKFLNDYYFGNEQWKMHKKEANALIRNSDNVHLLRPLNQTTGLQNTGDGIDSSVFNSNKPFAVIDFYIANTRLDELAAFYTKEYLPIQKALGFETTLWVSETAVNDFPQLPVFQDKNLLVAITFYGSENEFKAKMKKLNEKLPDEMKTKMLDIITIHSQMLLKNLDN
jgi:hypothetical protein